MSRTRPAWLTADIGALSLGAVTCPIYPSSEAGQAAFVINNVNARLLFVENLQQTSKIEKVRAECPTLEHVVVIDDRGKLPPMAVNFDDIFDLAEAEPVRSASGKISGGPLAGTRWRPSSTPRERPGTPRAWC